MPFYSALACIPQAYIYAKCVHALTVWHQNAYKTVNAIYRISDQMRHVYRPNQHCRKSHNCIDELLAVYSASATLWRLNVSQAQKVCFSSPHYCMDLIDLNLCTRHANYAYVTTFCRPKQYFQSTLSNLLSRSKFVDTAIVIASRP